ncbi:hypothetical protein [Amycolatopsis sp. WAC 04197]|uniref:hypothetical protein n=1 Tax=Amycolatopsis sp. WAC 04197 TaxID=2203199 RepID=UPI000F76CEA1|nr:hypothetical protein [Amycolatopsis sp. WAC 04197]
MVRLRTTDGGMGTAPVSRGRRVPASWRARCFAVVCRAVLLGAFILAGFAVMNAFETAVAADTGCDPGDPATAPPGCELATVDVQETEPAARIATSPITTKAISLVNTTAERTTALVGSAAPVLAPAIEQVTAMTTALTQTVDTAVSETVTTVNRTLDNPITTKLTGTVSALAPVVSSTGLQPRISVPGIVTITATEGSQPESPRLRPVPETHREPVSAAPQPSTAVDLPVVSAPAAPLDGDCAFCVNGPHEPSSFQWPTATAAPADLGSQRPVDRLPLGFPAAPIGAVGPGAGTSSAGSSGGHAQGAIVLPGRSAHDQRIACWSVGPDHIAPLRKRAQQPPVSPD